MLILYYILFFQISVFPKVFFRTIYYELSKTIFESANLNEFLLLNGIIIHKNHNKMANISNLFSWHTCLLNYPSKFNRINKVCSCRLIVRRSGAECTIREVFFKMLKYLLMCVLLCFSASNTNGFQLLLKDTTCLCLIIRFMCKSLKLNGRGKTRAIFFCLSFVVFIYRNIRKRSDCFFVCLQNTLVL